MRNDLKEARLKAGLTQKQVADAIGRDQGTYSRYESGATAPDLEVAPPLAKVLGMDLLKVLYPDPAPKSKPAKVA